VRAAADDGGGVGEGGVGEGLAVAVHFEAKSY
jgi:hypothetical protein